MSTKERTPAAERETEFIRDTIGFLVLHEDCEQLAEMHGVQVIIEETKGKTKFLHVAGTSARIDRFLGDLCKRTRGVPVKWITIPYRGVLGKWQFKQQLKRIK